MSTRALVIALLLLLWVAPSSATVTYEYQGNPFTTFSAPSGSSNPWTTSDFVSGSFTLPNALPANLSDKQITTAALNFTDGVNTYSYPALSGVPFNVSTDASGGITNWFIQFNVVLAPGVPLMSLGTCHALCGTSSDGDSVDTLLGVQVGFASASNNNPGTWSIVPEPSTLALSSLPLLIFGAAVRRRRAADRGRGTT